MPSNYPGTYNATQSPSSAPGPNVAPTLALPAGTDPPNAASVAQPFKVAGDFIAWIMKVLGGTLTARAIAIDATGGSTIIQPAGSLSTSSDINCGGNGFFTGGLQCAATTKQVWYPGAAWQPMTGTWNANVDGAETSCTAVGKIRCALILPFSAVSSFRITRVDLSISKGSTTSTSLLLRSAAPNSASSIIASVSSTTSGVQTLSLTSLSSLCSAGSYLYLEYDADTGDLFSGALITYSHAIL